MKFIIITILIVWQANCFTQTIFVKPKSELFPEDILHWVLEQDAVNLSQLNPEALKKKRLFEPKRGSDRIEYSISADLKKYGTKKEIDNYDFWVFKISSDSACFLSFAFDKFYIPEDGGLVVLNEPYSRAIIYKKNDKKSSPQYKNKIYSELLAGDTTCFIYFEPKKVKRKGKIRICMVHHGILRYY